MATYSDIMQMCRLCLVKDQVNLPIFGGQGDIQQIFLKITACLPVKVSREDNLPKNICDGCSYKLDLLYQFWNTSSNSEKQLIDWLTAAGVDPKHKSLEPIGLASQSNVILKQEPVTELDAISAETQNYLIQQQQLAYKPEEYEEPQDPIQSTKKKASSETGEETPSKRPRRVTRNTKSIQDVDDSDEEYVDNLESGIAKTEDETEEEDEDEDDEDGEGDDGDEDGDEDTADPDFVAADDEDTDQPGPSGISGNKTTTATYEEEEVYNTDEGETEEILIETVADSNYQCEVCALCFPNRESYLEHHMSQFGSRFSCCRCGISFKNTTQLYKHYETHKTENATEYYLEEDTSENDKYETEYIVTEEVDETSELYKELTTDDDQSTEVVYDQDHDEQVEAVINIPGDAGINSTQELLYILDDDNQCINEVVIETADQSNTRKLQQAKCYKPSVVEVDHGYIIPSCFRGQLESKARSKREQAGALIKIEDVKDNPTTSTVSYSEEVKAEAKSKNSILPRRRPQFPSSVPDFSATNYEVIQPNQIVDILHYKCLRCEQLFISKYVFFRHIEKGKCYINSCDVCPMTFSKNSDFYTHYVLSHTERAICNFCFRTFMYEKNVKEHMLRHLDQFRHRCEECNKGFYTVREYRNHYKNRHMGIRHKCTDCGRTFADDYYFKKHIATHGIQMATELIQI